MNDKGRGTLPEGVEWPMVDGRPVMPGDVLWDAETVRGIKVDRVGFDRDGTVLVAGDGEEIRAAGIDGIAYPAGAVSLDDLTRTEPSKPVLGKDGKAIEPGEVVWGEDGLSWLVTGFRWDNGDHVVEATAMGETKQLKPGWLTHEEPPGPVLDRDGVPIEVGDTVWHEVDGTELRVIGFQHEEDGERIVTVERVRGPIDWDGCRCLSLSHQRPDSWERLEKDAAKGACAYFGSNEFSCKECHFFGREHDCSGLMAMDIVRRAKALAGVGADE